MESEIEQVNCVVAFTTHIRTNLVVHNDVDRSDDDMSDYAFTEAYKILNIKWNKECRASEKQKENFEVYYSVPSTLAQLLGL